MPVKYNGQYFEHTPTSFARRVGQLLSTQDRREYQTRYRASRVEADRRAVGALEGADFDLSNIDWSKYQPGEIDQALTAGITRGAVGERSGDLEYDVNKAEAQALGYQTQRQRDMIEALGESAPKAKKGPSVLNRVLDVVSRPGYAIAEGYSRAQDAMMEDPNSIGNLGNVLAETGRGLGAGITGKEKTSFINVLEEKHGMKEGAGTTALGLAMDIALDPSTYMTLGTGVAAKQGAKGLRGVTAKQVVEEFAEEGGEKVFKEAIEQGAKSEPILNATDKVGKVQRRTIRQTAQADAKAFNPNISVSELAEVGNKAVKEAEDLAARRVADVATEAKRAQEALASTKEIQLKLGGMRIAGSEKLYRPIRGVTGGFKGTRIGSTLNEAFRTDAVVGGQIRGLERRFSNVAGAQYEEELRQIQRTFSGTTKKERAAISRAIEGGTGSAAHAAIAGNSKLLKLHDEAKSMFEDIAAREVDSGALKVDELKDNYLYHTYKNKHYRRKIGDPLPAHKRKFATLDEAKRVGADPVEDIADILAHRLAKSHRIVARYDLHTEIANRFGINLSQKTARNKSLRRLQNQGVLVDGRKVSSIMPPGTFFDTEVAQSLKQLDEFFTNEKISGKFLDQFDKLQAKFKFAVTAPNPGFHVRNLMGDVFANMLDGVVDLRVYNMAENILRKGDKYKGVVQAGSHRISAEDIKILYEGQGLKSGFFHADTGLIPTPGKNVITKASSAIRTASEFREDWTRMAHFIDALKKEARANPKLGREAIAEKAAARVRKFNFDYQDLTNIEKKVFRRAVPFYTFMRKNIPLQLESLFTRPGRVAVLPKGLRAMQELIGEETSQDPYPGLPEVIPDWIREFPSIQMQQETLGQDSIFLQPDFPINQLQDFGGGFINDEGGFDAAGGLKQFGSEVIGGGTPIVTMPFEYFSGHDIQTGAPITGSFKDQLLNQIPAIATQRAVMGGDYSKSQQKIPLAGQQLPERLLNYITGMGFRANTPNRQKSQLRKDQDILDSILEKLKNDLKKEAGVPEGLL